MNSPPAASDVESGRALRLTRDEGFDLEIRRDIYEGFRRAIYLAIILIPMFGILDAISVEVSLRRTFWIIRGAVAVVLLLLLQILRSPSRRERWLFPVTMVSCYVTGASIALMSALFDGHQSYYYAGMNLVLLGMSMLVPFGPKLMLASSISIYLTYILLCLTLDARPLDEWQWHLFLNNLFFCFSTGAIVTLGAYFSHYLRRKAYDARFEQNRANAELMLVNGRLQRSYAEISDKKQELEEAYRFKSTFLDNMSHELRTPLTCILTPLEGLLAGNVQGDLRLVLEDMDHASRQLYDMINDLLDYSRYGEREAPLRRVLVDVSSLINNNVRTWKSTARQRMINLVWDPPLEPLIAFGDPRELAKVVRNLVSNAIKFTEPKGSVTVTVGRVGDHLQLEVSDSGIGMSDEVQRQIFKAFYQADASMTRAFAGTGIGLALVKSIVERHEGRIRVDSQLGVGTTMKVTLPLDPVSTARARSGAIPAATGKLSGLGAVGPIMLKEKDIAVEVGETGQTELERFEQALWTPSDVFEVPEKVPTLGEHLDVVKNRRARIALIDDNPGILRMLERLLKDYDLVCATDGEEGLTLIEEHRPDLVISDVMMPKVDGFEMVARMRQRPEFERIPVLMLTARAEGQDRIRGLTGGASDYLVKPFAPAELLARVQNLLRSQHFATYLTRLNEELETKSTSLESRIHGFFVDTVRTLVAAIDAKDYYTGGHSERVSFFSVKIGEKLALPRPALRTVELGALLHDIGKIGIPDKVLNKPGRLSDEEIEIIRKHTVLGGKILEKSPELFELRRFALSHHERWDGRGYPEGLHGSDIPQSVRVVSVADCWDAMVSDRVYRPGMEPQVAASKIGRLGGSQFDPEVVEALMEVWQELELPATLRPLKPLSKPVENRAGPRVSECGEIYHVHDD